MKKPALVTQCFRGSFLFQIAFFHKVANFLNIDFCKSITSEAPKRLRAFDFFQNIRVKLVPPWQIIKTKVNPKTLQYLGGIL